MSQIIQETEYCKYCRGENCECNPQEIENYAEEHKEYYERLDAYNKCLKEILSFGRLKEREHNNFLNKLEAIIYLIPFTSLFCDNDSCKEIGTIKIFNNKFCRKHYFMEKNNVKNLIDEYYDNNKEYIHFSEDVNEILKLSECSIHRKHTCSSTIQSKNYYGSTIACRTCRKYIKKKKVYWHGWNDQINLTYKHNRYSVFCSKNCYNEHYNH